MERGLNFTEKTERAWEEEEEKVENEEDDEQCMTNYSAVNCG